MNIHLSRSTMDSRQKILDLIDENIFNPNPNIKRIIKELKGDAEKIAHTMNTPGWIDVIEPFLRHAGDPQKLFGLRKDCGNDTAEYERRMAKIEAFNMILSFFNKLVDVLKLARKYEAMEAQMKEEEITEEID